MAKETPNEKRMRQEQELSDKNSLELYMKRRGVKQDIKNLFGDTGYGTSLSAGAEYAGSEAGKKEWEKGKNLREMEPEVRKAMREAAAEERRETRGKKAGGVIKSASARADGCAIRGKTRGKMV